MTRLFLIFIFIFISGVRVSYSSDKLVPLKVLISEETSLDRHIYVNERCAGLNQALGARFQGSSRDPDKKISAQLFLLAANHSIYAKTFSEKAGISYGETNMVSRALVFSQIYRKEMDRLYDLNGSFTIGIIKADIDICNQIYKNAGSIEISTKQNRSNDDVIFLGVKKVVDIKHKDQNDLCYIENLTQYDNGFAGFRGIGVAFTPENDFVLTVNTPLMVTKTKLINPTHFLSNDLRDKTKWNKLNKGGMYFSTGSYASKILEEFAIKEQEFINIIKDKTKKINFSDVPSVFFEYNGKKYAAPMVFQEYSKFLDCLNRLKKVIVKKLKK
ncbi:hypothetical protein OAM56_06380 [Alphaproteobacteria bacterium]|nr:hypothetical protein [Alphaproteobacteria bacterium]